MKKVVSLILLACIVFSLAACDLKKAPEKDPKEERYEEACALLEKRDYESAYALFLDLGDYKDAQKQAEYFRYMPVSHYVECSPEEETITYTVTLNGSNLPETVVEEHSTGFKHTCSITYNEFGFITRRECSDTDGAKTAFEVTYDEKGNAVTEAITDKDGNVSRFDATYNEDGKVIKAVTTNAPDYYLSYTYTYDDAGREIKVVYEVEDGSCVDENVYNEEGNLLKNTWTDENGSVTVTDYVYDEKGRLTDIIFTEDGESAGFRKATFNDEDQMVSEHIVYSVGVEYTNSYEYDEHGNQIKRTHSSKEGTETYSEVIETEYKLVYLPFEYTEEEWMEIFDSTECVDWAHQ